MSVVEFFIEVPVLVELVIEGFVLFVEITPFSGLVILPLVIGFVEFAKLVLVDEGLFGLVVLVVFVGFVTLVGLVVLVGFVELVGLIELAGLVGLFVGVVGVVGFIGFVGLVGVLGLVGFVGLVGLVGLLGVRLFGVIVIFLLELTGEVEFV